MILDQNRQTIPTNLEYSGPQIRTLIRQVEAIITHPVSQDEWDAL
jgi:hypothetical protein